MITKHPGISLIAILSLLLAALALPGCDNLADAAAAADEGAVVSGTVTLPASVSDKTWAVYLDTDIEVGNGFTKAAGGTVTGTSFAYNMTGVPAGTYYIYAVVYMGATVTGGPSTGDYVSMYGAESVESLPSAANCPVPASGTAVYDMSAMLMPDMGGDDGDDDGDDGDGDDDGDDGVTVTGTVTLPAAVSGKAYLVIVDNNYDGGDGYEGILSGSATGSTIDYSIGDVTPGSYYVYAIVYNSGASGGSPTAGDYFGAWGANSIADWPGNTPKASVTDGGANDFDFALYTAPDMGDDPDGDSTLAQQAGDALEALGRAHAAVTPVVNASGDATWTFAGYTDETSGYTLTGVITQLQGTSTVSGTVNFTGGEISTIIVEDVNTDGSGGAFYITFVSGGEYSFINGVLTPID